MCDGFLLEISTVRPETMQTTDLELIEKLIAERLSMREAGDFPGADALRERLRDLGVATFDRAAKGCMWSLVRENDESGVYDSFWHQRG